MCSSDLVVPDVLVLGKALGGGMPLGAFIARRKAMMQLTHDPVLGHITTFGGHPVSCAAGLAAFRVLLKEKLIGKVKAKSELFGELLNHPSVKAVRRAGLLIAVEFADASQAKKVIDQCIKTGVLTDWFLFAPHCLRIAPPLTITAKEIRKACRILMEAAARVSDRS